MFFLSYEGGTDRKKSCPSHSAKYSHSGSGKVAETGLFLSGLSMAALARSTKASVGMAVAVAVAVASRAHKLHLCPQATLPIALQ